MASPENAKGGAIKSHPQIQNWKRCLISLVLMLLGLGTPLLGPRAGCESLKNILKIFSHNSDVSYSDSACKFLKLIEISFCCAYSSESPGGIS